VTIERLRELEAAASGRPWYSQPSEHDLVRGIVYGPDGDSLCVVDWNPGTENDPVADASLIAAARNALPALLDVAEAAALYVGANEPGAHERLAAALAKLDEVTV